MASSMTAADATSDKYASVRKHYKIVVDCIRRLDQAAKDKQNVAAVSQPETILIRDRLRDSCEKLLFISPLEYGKKAEDQIWKKCFYEPIQALRANKERLSEKQKCWAVMFVQAAVGYYHGFLLRLQREFGVDVNIDVAQYCLVKADKQNVERHIWGLAAVRKTLTCLGDLMRYSLDLSGNEQDFYLAEHYYLEAHAIDPTQGMPMNQLGTLAEDRNFGVDALFYYLRCLLSKESFEGTPGNISFVLKRSKKAWEQLNGGDADKYTCSDQFKLAFVTLMEIFFEDTQISPQEFADAVQVTLSKLRASLRFQEKTAEKITPMVFLRVLLIEMMIRTRLEQKGSVKLRAMTMFILDNASILFDYIAESLKQNAAASPIGPAVVQQIRAAEPKPLRTRNNSERKRGNKTRTLPPMARRRRRGSSSDEDGEDDGGRGSSSPISEIEDDNSDVQSERDDDGADIVELSDSSDEELMTASGKDNADGRAAQNGSVGDKNKTTSTSSTAADKFAVLLDCDWLKVVKLTVDWLRFSVAFITSAADERHPIWKAFANLLNTLPSEQDMSNGVSDGMLGASESGDLRSSHDWQQKDVLPEDVLVRGVAVFDSTHAALNWDERCRSSPAAQVAIRLLTVRSFGRYLAEMKLVGFAFDRDTTQFSAQTAEKKNNLLVSSNDAASANRATGIEQRDNVMKSMGKLRMQEEMRQLQKDAWVPVYLVPDLGVIVDKLHLLKQLAGAHKFVVVVQLSIIRTLDKMKKESAAVRESIRWLEMCLQQGNKYVRAQKETEQAEVNDTSDLSREIVDALSCCASLSSKLSSGGATIATLITSQSAGSAPFRAFQDAIRQRAIYGIDIANVHQFNRRWMAHSKQHG